MNTEIPNERPPSIKLQSCLTLLKRINIAMMKGQHDLADKLRAELRAVEGPR